MIELSSQLCCELSLTYWQLNSLDDEVINFNINREEKDLLRKILLAKGAVLCEDLLEVHDAGVVVVNLPSYKLIFDDVKLADENKTIHLAKISDMLKNQQQKKLTWHKLKNINL